MIKMVTLLKRRAGMSREAFIEYYENHHRLIGERVLRGHAQRYVRRYLQPMPPPLGGEIPEPEHDVVMEIWFADQAAMDAAMAAITAPAMAAEIAADEERLFDRSKLRSFTVVEHESDM